MKFEVMSRHKARNESFKKDIDDCIIISITDMNSEQNRFNKNSHIKGVLHLTFDDCDFGEENCIQKSDGEKIIRFVNQYIDKVEKIIVHCEAGVSRSAGVCAGLMLIINGNDNEIFDNGKFCPNMSCYRTIVETYYGSYNEKAADEKITKNIKMWRIAQGFDNPE